MQEFLCNLINLVVKFSPKKRNIFSVYFFFRSHPISLVKLVQDCWMFVVAGSVSRLLDSFSTFGEFTSTEICLKVCKICQRRFKILPNCKKKTSKTCPRLSQSGKILPNLVTLVTEKKERKKKLWLKLHYLFCKFVARPRARLRERANLVNEFALKN